MQSCCSEGKFGVSNPPDSISVGLEKMANQQRPILIEEEHYRQTVQIYMLVSKSFDSHTFEFYLMVPKDLSKPVFQQVLEQIYQGVRVGPVFLHRGLKNNNNKNKAIVQYLPFQVRHRVKESIVNLKTPDIADKKQGYTDLLAMIFLFYFGRSVIC